MFDDIVHVKSSSFSVVVEQPIKKVFMNETNENYKVTVMAMIQQFSITFIQFMN